jgi:RNA polymerase sigma factor (sigma-70 family)
VKTSARGGNARPTHDDHAGRAAPAVALRTAAQAEAMVVATVQGHADDLLRVARRYSYCVDDAHEAYQRALEIYVRHARRLEAETAHRWLFTVLKHEALAVRRQRGQLQGADEGELDRLESRTTDSPEDRAIAADDVSRAAAALRRLKPDEIRALWLKASGLSYAEIMAETQWSYTKVNRCLAEGRASLARHRRAIESGGDCEQYLPLLSRLLDGEASRKELRPLRLHLKACSGCRAELRSLHERGDALRLVLPSGVLAGSAATESADVPALVTRLYESIATTIHDRAAMSAIKLQAAIEATSTGKLAAVAASAAAVAGGGAAAATDLPDRTPPATHAAPHGAVTPAKRTAGPTTNLSAAATAAPGPAATPTPPVTARRTGSPAPRPRRQPSRRKQRPQPGRQEFAAPSPDAGARRVAQQAAQEFGAPSPSAAPRPAPSAATATAPTVGSAGGSVAPGSASVAAQNEFSP